VNPLLEALGMVGTTLDTPGSMARGLLSGQHERAFGGIMDPSRRVSGRDMLQQWGVLGDNEEGLDFGDVAGFGAEMLTDPLSLMTGAGTGLLARRAMRAGRTAGDATPLFKAAEEAMPAFRSPQPPPDFMDNLASMRPRQESSLGDVMTHGREMGMMPDMPAGPKAGPMGSPMEIPMEMPPSVAPYPEMAAGGKGYGQPNYSDWSALKRNDWPDVAGAQKAIEDQTSIFEDFLEESGIGQRMPPSALDPTTRLTSSISSSFPGGYHTGAGPASAAFRGQIGDTGNALADALLKQYDDYIGVLRQRADSFGTPLVKNAVDEAFKLGGDAGVAYREFYHEAPRTSQASELINALRSAVRRRYGPLDEFLGAPMPRGF
jgi:hypothetical protein